MLQTEWQARNKHGGLSGSPTKRRALLSHIATYTLAFVPALVCCGDSVDGWVFRTCAADRRAHLIQDDGRLLSRYARRIKKTDISSNPMLEAMLDQSFHVLALFLTALLAGSGGPFV